MAVVHGGQIDACGYSGRYIGADLGTCERVWATFEPSTCDGQWCGRMFSLCEMTDSIFMLTIGLI